MTLAVPVRIPASYGTYLATRTLAGRRYVAVVFPSATAFARRSQVASELLDALIAVSLVWLMLLLGVCPTDGLCRGACECPQCSADDAEDGVLFRLQMLSEG